jgi:hypothetical protein
MGRTGSGRKGEATTVAEVFLRRAKLSTFPALTVAGLSSGEGLIEQVCEDRRLLVIETEFSSVMARSRTDISALFSRNLKTGVLDELLAGLIANGNYEIIRAETGGRPAETYRRTSFV